MFPILEISVFFAVIGKDPKGLTIAVVNEELENMTDCTEESPWNAYLDEEEVCRMSGISCLFINGISDTLATKVSIDFHFFSYIILIHLPSLSQYDNK